MNYRLQDILNKVCCINSYMCSEKLTYLYFWSDECDYYRIYRNTTPSPDGVYGMFLLLKRERFRLRNPVNDADEIILRLSGGYEFKSLESVVRENQAEFLKMFPEGRRRIQEKIEFFIYIKMRELGLDPLPASREEQDYYDYITSYGFTIEVKSDRYRHTGNISLELLRDHRIPDCVKAFRNIGSILKTKADYWVECLYNTTTIEVEVYRAKILQEKTLAIIDCLYNKLRKSRTC